MGDLILECDVIIDDSNGELVLELCKGADRFRASWDLATATCTLSRLKDGKIKDDVMTEQLESASSRLGKGSHRLRFANVDERLTVWVDNSLVFGEGRPYEPPEQRDRTEKDKQPAAIAARGARVTVQHIQLWRNTYYLTHPNATESGKEALFMYVQPGHYLCLGDNSAHSDDGRSWGLVPEHLLFGRAVLIWWPPGRMGLVH